MTYELNTAAFRALLAESGLTIPQMVTLTKLNRTCIERWRSGKITRVRLSSLEAVASALGVSVAELVLEAA